MLFSRCQLAFKTWQPHVYRQLVFFKKIQNCHPLCQYEPTESTLVSTDSSKTMFSLALGINISQRALKKTSGFKGNKPQMQTGINMSHLNQVKVFLEATVIA